MFKKIFSAKKPNDADLFTPHMPEVEMVEDIEGIFEKARKMACGEMLVSQVKPGQRFLIVVTPGRIILQKFCPPAGSMTRAQIAPMEKMLPPAVKRNVAVIASTELKGVSADLNRAIPFAGILMGFAYIGHAVWAFEGHPSALEAGCRDADLLLVDSGMLPFLAENWAATAMGVMRNKEIYVHDRATYKLMRVGIKKKGE